MCFGEFPLYPADRNLSGNVFCIAYTHENLRTTCYTFKLRKIIDFADYCKHKIRLVINAICSAF